jgi:putative aldouronate transport system permease protein
LFQRRANKGTRCFSGASKGKAPFRLRAKNMVHRKTPEDYIVNAVITITMIFVVVITLYPFLNAVAISFNNSDDTTRGGITIIPRVFTLKNYELILQNPRIYKAYFITVSRTVIGALAGLYMTGALAFGLAHPQLKNRKFYIAFCLIPMYFGGGLIPFYLLIKQLGLVNTFWVYIIPGMVGLWNMLIMRTYFQGIPPGLEESAMIDDANYFGIFFRIIIPISTPIAATIALFIGVSQWNAWFDAAMFITSNQDIKPMQSVLLSIISEASFAERMAAAGRSATEMAHVGKGKETNVRSITMATMIITIVPVICVYPFLQKYFEKGVMIGSIKG